MFCLNTKFAEGEGGQWVVSSVLRGGQLGAKVHPEDVLSTVDFKPVSGLSEKEVTEMMSGPAASEVTLGFYRPQHLDVPAQSFEVVVTRVASEMQDIQARVLRAILEELHSPAVDADEMAKVPGASLWAQVVQSMNKLKLDLEALSAASKNAQLLSELRDAVRRQQRDLQQASAEDARQKQRIGELEAAVHDVEAQIEKAMGECKEREQNMAQEKVNAEAEAKAAQHRAEQLTAELSSTADQWRKAEDELKEQLKERDKALQEAVEQIESLNREQKKLQSNLSDVERVLGAAVTVTVSEAAKMARGGKQERRRVQNELAADMCRALGVSTRRIEVIGAQRVQGPPHAGALKMDMQILPKSTAPSEPAAVELVEQVVRQTADEESKLRVDARLGEFLVQAEPAFPHVLIRSLREQALLMDAQLDSAASGKPGPAQPPSPTPSPRDTRSVTGLGALRGIQQRGVTPSPPANGDTKPDASSSPASRNSHKSQNSEPKKRANGNGVQSSPTAGDNPIKEGWQGAVGLLESFQSTLKL